jgi:hypothetical protein
MCSISEEMRDCYPDLWRGRVVRFTALASLSQRKYQGENLLGSLPALSLEDNECPKKATVALKGITVSIQICLLLLNNDRAPSLEWRNQKLTKYTIQEVIPSV